MTETSLQDMIRALPPELQKEVHDFVKFLSAQRANKPKAKMRSAWQGALKDLRSQYTSVELQHKISDMRAGFD
ncbi:MAG: DUF2281 domain-containing protein [Chloroflexota bacterium]